MANSTVIQSAHDGTILEFSDFDDDYFNVRISGPNFNGMAKVYFYEPHDLPSFFADLALHWRGWQGKKEWSSLEGELKFNASSDSTGHINLSTQLRNKPYVFGWTLSTVLLLEAGMLEQIARDAKKFFKQDGAA
jgi:hypothetical protein